MTTKYEEKGLRFLLTYGCSKKCPFCYQLNRTDDRRVLPLDTFKNILEERAIDKYDYVTLFGGEVMEIPNFTEYVKIARAAFPGRINMTTNGDAPVEKYMEVVEAGVDHINFSVNTPFNLDYAMKIARVKCGKRLNIFLPTDYDKKVMDKIIKPWIEQARTLFRCQVSLMYDYRNDVVNYEMVAAKIDEIIAHLNKRAPVRIHTGPNYLIYKYDMYFEFWVDVNYRKNQELIVDPQGKQVRGFDYMLEEEQ
jgi:organic radical activating enzyme